MDEITLIYIFALLELKCDKTEKRHSKKNYKITLFHITDGIKAFYDKPCYIKILQPNICIVFWKTAICYKQVAVFFSTKYPLFRLYALHKSTQVIETEKICVSSFYSLKCRSPPSLFWFLTKISKRRSYV